MYEKYKWVGPYLNSNSHLKPLFKLKRGFLIICLSLKIVLRDIYSNFWVGVSFLVLRFIHTELDLCMVRLCVSAWERSHAQYMYM